MENIDELVNNFERARISEPLHTTFSLFPTLPTELRLKIWNLCITPRIINYNHSATKHSKLKLDPLIPPLLHTSREARYEAIRSYKLSTLSPRKLYTNPSLDTLIWIRTNGPRTFRRDVERLSADPALEFHFKYLAISSKFWNRITTNEQYEEVYKRIRTGGGWVVLQIANDSYGCIRWSEVMGKGIKLVKGQTHKTWDFTGAKIRSTRKEKLWAGWDNRVVYEG
ncbi:hypothetical protein BKA65DRAFT_553645 [Rhexocercosporidium sp. MPI-PUGE-AT-0058]|nr:hypothetical protein BKA65DRAFT_553645 [Rhexocercosporidium sp. MPI-PUGE-AT-0058]